MWKKAGIIILGILALTGIYDEWKLYLILIT